MTSGVKSDGGDCLAAHLQFAILVTLSAGSPVSVSEDRLVQAERVSSTSWRPHENPEQLIVLVPAHTGYPGERTVRRVFCCCCSSVFL